MRLEKLHLLAYGPFTQVELDFAPAGVHLVYGKNEAGKSTALRALIGLLYGIARSTPDAHRHKMPDLRIGGTFRDPAGGSIYLVRRKGRDNTLLDREGHPVDEATLTRLLGGVSEEQFVTLFGLDHETLRRGGESLLLGEGEIGESLFGAAMAGGELHQVLRSLRAEAEGLFTPKAHTRPLHEALKAWTDANRRARDESMSPESVHAQMRALEDLRGERAEADADRQKLAVERGKLERARRALPLMTKRKALLERRLAMGPVATLPAGAARDRVEQQRVRAEAALEIERLAALLRDLEARRGALSVPEPLLEREEIARGLGNRLGGHLQAIEELPRLARAIAAEEAGARGALRALGRDVSLEEAERWRMSPPTQAAVRRLALESAALDEAEQRGRRALLERRARLAPLAAQKGALLPARDVSALKRAVARAERDGSLDERLARAAAQRDRAEAVLRAELAALGLGEMSLLAACGLPVPQLETAERFARQRAALEQDAARWADERAVHVERAAQLARDLEALELYGKLPSERDLALARERRDDAWRLVRRALVRGAGEPPEEREALAAALEAEQRGADVVADRLRREADRISRLTALLADRDAETERSAALEGRAEDLAARRAADERGWRAAWEKSGIAPEPPAEMREWIRRHAAVVRGAGELSAIEAEIAALTSARDGHAAPIGAMMLALGAAPPPSAGLAVLLDRASELLDAAAADALGRERLGRDVADLEAQIAELTAEERDHERTRAGLDEAWRAALDKLGLPPGSSPDEAIHALDALVDAFRKIDQIATTRGRAAELQRGAAAFAAEVAELTRELSPDLARAAPEQAAEALIDRYHQGRAAEAERRELDRQIALAERQRDLEAARLRGAEGRLGELLRAAGADEMAGLERAERRSEEAALLDRQIEELSLSLIDLGADPAAADPELEALDLDVTQARLADLEAELEQMQERVSVIDVRIGSARAGLAELGDPRARAAEAAADAEAVLAKVRAIADRYLVARLSAVVLAREIERYRKENQGPVLSRASALFERLTLGSFASLRADIDDKDRPVLRGVRGDGSEAGVEGMSDGTRDQLYLALRLATLERYAKHGEPVPFVLDDALVHFDDDRARAALEVLGELSGRTQVLFFTHHARLVELARSALPRDRLFVRELSESAALE